MSELTAFTLRFGIMKRNELSFQNTHINSGTKASTLCKYLGQIGSVTSELKKKVLGMFSATGPQFVDRRPFGTLAFRNGLKYHNFYFNRLIGNDFYTSQRNSATFG